MNKVYVFGHKKPDTDSVCASITMANLMNQTNTLKDTKYIPRVLGAVNNESKFVLDKFNIDSPKYLNDVKLQIRDVNYRKDFYVDRKEPIINAYNLMNVSGASGIPIVNKEENNKLVGLITLKELAKELIEGNRKKVNTSYNNILDVIKGEEVLRYDDEIKGNVIAATYRSTTFLSDVTLTSDSILIIGDRHSILEYAVEVGVKLIILIGNSDIKDKHLEEAKKNNVNIIRTEKGSFEVSNLLSLCNYSEHINCTYTPTIVKDSDFLTDFNEITNQLRYSNYPVVNIDGNCLGMIRITDVVEKSRKKVILVDHNEKTQSVEGLEEAEIVEIIDHHRLGAISTSAPINFRNMNVGSTCTIIYGLYKQYNVELTYEIAGLLLSAILSDTLLLKSPTTTDIDREAVSFLSNYLNIDYEKYGFEMFKAGSSLKGKTIEEIIYQDFKQFESDDTKIGIGQVFTTNFDEIDEVKDEYIKTINDIAVNNNYDIVCLFVTDIIRNGSYVLFNEKSRNSISLAFNKIDIEEGCFLEDIVSRKKQMVTAIIDVLDKK